MNIPLLILAVLWVISTLVVVASSVFYGMTGRSDKFLTSLISLVIIAFSQGMLYAAGLWTLW
jgi:hypothetical protein